MGSMGIEIKHELPKVDLSGLGLAGPGSEAWAKALADVARSLASYGGFDAVYNHVESELLELLFDRAIPEALKQEEKLSYATSLPSDGRFLHRSGMAFSSLLINGAESFSTVQEYANTLWLEGNNLFCKAVHCYAKHMQELVQIVHRMIFESLGLEDYCDSHIKSLAYSIKLSQYYNKIQDHGTEIGMLPHTDSNYVSIICQHKVDGLEIETPDGEWIQVAPKQNLFTVLLGEATMAKTNGRFLAANHRVNMDKHEKRYSIIYSTIPNFTDDIVRAMDELVDDRHPLLFKPFKYYDYLKFRFSNGVQKLNDLKSYCGVGQ